MNNQAFRKLSYGVYIVSCKEGDEYKGCTANSIMQITSDPQMIALSLNHSNYTNSCLQKNGKFAVSILSEKSNPLSIGTFGFRTSRDFDKFANIPFDVIDGLPIIKDACAYLICEIKEKVETSTHTIFLANVHNADVLNEEQPMTYAYYHNVIKGKSPKTAPTYIDEK